MLAQEIYTLEEVGRYLRVPVQVIQKEIAAGKLLAKNVGGFVRISRSALADYLNAANADATSVFETPKEAAASWLHLEPSADFDYRWPDGTTVEQFSRVQEGTASYEGRPYHVKLGFTVREAAGRPRSRCLVIVDRYPTVEFTKADAEDKVGPLASIIKDRAGKQIPATAAAPPEYDGLPVGSYREVVDGPYASNGLAVLCSSDDFETMVKHALIRYRFREERG